MRNVRASTLLVVALIAVAGGALVKVTGALDRLERVTLSERFQLRGTSKPDDIVVVSIDDVTFAALQERWPFPRSLHGRAIDRLRAAGAKEIVYDVQFTEPTENDEDVALYDAIDRAGGAVLATNETDGRGRTNVLGGDEMLADVHARAASSAVEVDGGGSIASFPFEQDGLKSIGVVTAERVTGKLVPRSAFRDGKALIDFRGPPGTVPTVSFSKLLLGQVDSSAFRGKVVVIGAGAPTLQDVHATPVGGDDLMPGAELQADAIWTALHGFPLRRVPPLVDWLLIALLALVVPLARLRVGILAAGAAALGAAVVFAGAAYLAFTQGWVVGVIAPLVALLIATVGTIVASHVTETTNRRLAAWEKEVLEERVREATAELRQTQLEVAQRLAVAVESRDTETGLHVERMSHLCERLGVAMGMDEADAEMLRHASVLHDVGKVGIPDAILSKPGRLDAEEWEVMKSHTVLGERILRGSQSPLVQMGRTIALTHHERWDGSGYPNGLAGEGIPLVGRIAAVCDVFDALLSSRPYKEPWPIDRALAEIEASSGTHFDPAVVAAFLPIAVEVHEEWVSMEMIVRESVDPVDPVEPVQRPEPVRV
jgi:CHASE2 domain-containing sensor protein